MPSPRFLQPARTSMALIETLVSTLTPVRPAPPWAAVTVGWLIAAACVVMAALLASGPLRPGLQTSLATPRLALEVGLGGLTALALIGVGLERDVPGSPRTLHFTGPSAALASVALWLGLIAAPAGSLDALGLTGPESASVGRRPHCLLEGVAFAALPVGLALSALDRRTVAPSGLSGALIGLAAGVLIATGMQLACQWNPAHALRFHVVLVWPVALGSGLVTRFGLPRVRPLGGAGL